MAERLFSAFYRLLAGILALLCAGLFVYGLFATVVFRQYQENDYPDVVRLNPLLTAAVFAALSVLLWLLLKKTGILARTRAPRLTRGGMLVPDRWFWGAFLFAAFFCGFLLFVIRGLPTNDAKLCIEIAQDFLRGDYSAIYDGYIAYCPHQLSYCLVSEWLTLAFGAENYAVYQIGNVISILLSLFFFYEITWELFADARMCDALAILSVGCWEFYAYSTFIYNDIWSLAPLFGALWLLIRFLKRDSIPEGVLAAVFAGLSFFIKTNSAVALVAMGCVCAAACLKAAVAKNGRRARRCAAILALLILFSAAVRGGVNAYYERRGGQKIPAGEPAMAYIAMGIEENDGKYGWYNGANVRYLRDAEGDSGKAARAAGAYVKERLSLFVSHPKTGVKFYLMKFLSQWGDPTKVSLREQELTGRHQEGMRPALAESLTFGTGFLILQAVMHLFHLALCFFACIGLLSFAAGRRRIDEISILLPLFVFGGALFHELWEASGRYVLRYELALLPFAAWGVIRMFSLPFQARKKKRGRNA